jgi:hypothetical protein
VDDLVVIAAALGTPPTALLLPLPLEMGSHGRGR